MMANHGYKHTNSIELNSDVFFPLKVITFKDILKYSSKI